MASYTTYYWLTEDPETKVRSIAGGPSALQTFWVTPYAYEYEGNVYPEGLAISGFNNLTDEELRAYGWLPLILIDPPHTWYDNFDGSTTTIEATTVVETNQYSPKSPAQIEQELAVISDQGKALLAATDWTDIPATGDPTKSNPYLANQNEFTAWRSQVRYLVLNPNPEQPYPLPPIEDWKYTNA